MQQYAAKAKELLDNVAKLTVRQEPVQRLAPQVLQASSSTQAPRPSVPVEVRVSQFKQELLASRINLDELRRLAFQGIPDKDGLRSMTWKLLLGYLPPDPSEWDKVLARKRTEYFLFCEDLIVDPKRKQEQQQRQQQIQQLQQEQQQTQQQDAADGTSSKESVARHSSNNSSSSTTAAAALAASMHESGDPLRAQRSSNNSSNGGGSSVRGDPLTSTRQLQPAVPDDHPLSLQSTSIWHTYFKDNEVMEQIDRDVMRTHPDMHFFSGDSTEAEQHRKEMKRCLFMYAKLNPGLHYIQGMNELLAPIYYLCRTDPDRTSAQYAEADSFYCFVDLISEFRDHFCQQLDNSSSGIRATISKLVVLLQAHDEELANHLQLHKVEPQFFAFRWITLLLTQEFPFPDSVRIWDTLLSDPAGRLDCLLRVCVALLCHVRQQLLAGDFAVIVKTLQRYPSVDVDVILRAAARLPPCSTVLGGPL
eukprot:GHRR01006031.1.p1 GENE.GHRR01006031.1~~GHRR01006031.1.p1  ORF type:complete len:476 (+),score=176.35 GHRR01006031.1:122-1549(+)